MTDYVIIGLLVLIWLSDTRYGVRFANKVENGISYTVKWFRRVLRRK